MTMAKFDLFEMGLDHCTCEITAYFQQPLRAGSEPYTLKFLAGALPLNAV